MVSQASAEGKISVGAGGSSLDLGGEVEHIDHVFSMFGVDSVNCRTSLNSVGGIAMVLPENWPATVPMRKVLVDTATGPKATFEAIAATFKKGQKRHLAFRGTMNITGSRLFASSSKSEDIELSDVVNEPAWSCMMVNPCSPIRALVDVCGLIVLIVDFVVYPYNLAWDVPVSGAVEFFGYVTAGFWTVYAWPKSETQPHRGGQVNSGLGEDDDSDSLGIAEEHRAKGVTRHTLSAALYR